MVHHSIYYANVKKWSSIPCEDSNYKIIDNPQLKIIINRIKRDYQKLRGFDSREIEEYLGNYGAIIRIRKLFPGRFSDIGKSIEIHHKRLKTIDALAKKLGLPLN